MRAPEKRLATVNLLIGMFRTQLDTHEAETKCTHAGTVAQLRTGLAKQEARAAELQEEISALEAAADVASPFDGDTSGMTQACREGQCHACVGDVWNATPENPSGCTCPHHTSNDHSLEG